MATSHDSLDTCRTVEIGRRPLHYYSLDAAEAAGAGPVRRLPRSLKVLYENLLRHEDGVTVTAGQLKRFAACLDDAAEEQEISFSPTRILMNDSAGIPLMADMAALRSATARNGGDPLAVNPQIQSDLVVDHSVMVDRHASPRAFAENLSIEFERNAERYRFLRWAQQSFSNFRAVPPGMGICHQVNLEALARCVWTAPDGNRTLVFPETLLGTDSHTPMINAIGVLGWGVGGIEAGAAMLGQPVTMMVPRVVGCRLHGSLPAGTNATDLVITLTERLRGVGVVGSFVEFFGEGLATLTLSDRATLANMAPEYGATMGFFPIDAATLHYLEETGRGGEHLELVESYARLQGLWHDPAGEQPVFGQVVELDLSEIAPSIAGPRRPQDRVPLSEAAERFAADVLAELPALPEGGAPVAGRDWGLDHGDVAIAAITSCTNTSNPYVMLGAGLLARKAVERGLTVKPWVKTSLAPGSRVVTDYLTATGLQAGLDQLGFHTVGYGCTTCMGNSGPLAPEIAEAIEAHDVCAVAVLSGNRNFEGRIHPLAKASYIASPPLVVAYAIAGSMRVDLLDDPLGTDADGSPVRLADIWPSPEEIAKVADRALTPARFRSRYSDLFEGDERWQRIEAPSGPTFPWPDSLYMKQPPFFDEVTPTVPEPADILGARPLVMLGDSITTDHISPVGTITASSAAGRYLMEQGVEPGDFNSFAARRVNHEVMIRGAFANIRLANEMAPERKGGWTRHQPSGELLPMHAAAARYRAEGVPLVVVAGRDYGSGSSRDWAAKGTRLLGVRAVIAEGFERIHRSNLIGMGVLPLQFGQGVTRHTLGLDGTETFDIRGIERGLGPRVPVDALIRRSDGSTEAIRLLCRLDTTIEVRYYRHGGMLHYVLRNTMGSA